MNNRGSKDTEDAAMQLKRAAGEIEEECRSVKLLRADEDTTLNMIQSSAMDATRAMFSSPQQQSTHFFVGSESIMPHSLQLQAQSNSDIQNHQIRMQMQQRQQQQQQYAAAMAARHHAQQRHQQAVAMATMMGKPGSPPGQLNNMKPMALAGQPLPSSDGNVHLDSLIGSQGMNYYMDTLSGDPAQQPSLSAAATTTVASQIPAVSVAPILPNEAEEPCFVCGMKGEIFTCNGGCGLHVHPACIGEDAIFPFVVGQLCGSCFIVQQNRASPEDLTRGGPNALSVRRAILCVNLETNNTANFDKFGHLASLRLAEIGSIAGYPIKPFAEKFVEPYLLRWIREKLSTTTNWMLNVREVFTVMIGLYSLKRACIAHGLHHKVINLMKARKFTVMDYFGWHPAVECPSVRCSSLCAICGTRNAPSVDLCSRCHHKLVFPTTFTKYISTLLAAFYAEQVGISLGASTLDVFAHTNIVRGLYKGLRPFDADGVVWDLFTDQLRMIFGLLDIMSNFGTLQLNPDLFAPEVNIIFNAAYVNQAMITNEFEVVGKLLQCMKLFGLAKRMENKNMIESCERYLLFKHLPNGSWCKTNGSKVEQYKATVTCSKALLNPEFRGYGPMSLDFQRLLEKWARNSSPKHSTMARGKQPAETAKLKRLVSGVIVKAHTQARLKRLEATYKRQIAPNGRDSSLESLVTERMKQLLKAKNLKASTKSVSSAEKEKAGEAATILDNEKDGINEKESHDETVLMKENAPNADSTSASEDVKSGHELNRDLRASADKSQDDDDMLTSMSLHEDLEIFDGLQFEDGGGIIDMSLHALRHNREVVEDSVERALEDTDGTDVPGQDDDEDENVYDDDEDENEDSASYFVDGETLQHQSQLSEVVETPNSSDVTTDFPSGI
ncbi:unnamed protein product [Peronospora belbahrii]|uniref:Zinc finger PHD-type domain-containing protein n=1 Tax=Peronospora belbahrii TaxID=622444 RepID=A0ABN8D427_9STRA|nr:unnamed protein product [Peronospora belbahrii]